MIKPKTDYTHVIQAYNHIIRMLQKTLIMIII